jgi:ABC-type amino acid transport substrate-binding protein
LIGNENYRPQLRRVKLSNDKNIILACSVDSLPEVLKQAQQVGLLTDEHQFIITSLDMHTIDLEPFQHSGTNITAARLVSSDDSFVKEITDAFAEMYKKTLKERKKKEKEEKEQEGDEENGGGDDNGEANESDDDDDDEDEDEEEQEEEEENETSDNNDEENNEEEEENETSDNNDEENNEEEEETDNKEEEEEEEEILEGLTPEKMRLDTALTFDAILLFSEVVKISDGITSKSIDCNNDSELRQHGISDIMAMKTVHKRRVKGLTGNIQFDQKGHRTDFVAEIIELASDGVQKVGVWNSSDGELYLARANAGGDSLEAEMSLRNKSFLVLTALSAPYGMLREASQAMTGNDRFEGFGVELIDKLSQKLGFNYTFKLQEDGAYGSLNRETGEWNGMLREIMDGRADLAITDLTITSEREGATDFTMPFMNLGISILFEKAKKEPPQLFSFLSPFSGEVWIWVIGALFSVSLSMFVMGRLSPAEWDNPYPCIEEPEVLENQFSLRNSFWFTIGAFMQQGSEIAPK